MCECTKSSRLAEKLMLSLRGRLDSSRLPAPPAVMSASTARASGRVSASSKGSTPAMGEPVTWRTLSMPACRLVRPTELNRPATRS
jgi:hypothetical protein